MNFIKLFLVRLGCLCGERTVHFLDALVNYLEVGRWMKAKGFCTSRWANSREEMFQQLAARVVGRRVLYLEFGVANGDSMRYWSKLLKNPDCRLHGFDTFEGLPLDWKIDKRKDAFSTGGRLPQIDDARVKFFKGLFEETLAKYVVPDYDILVINIDCDLYSSTFFVLKSLAEYLRRGTYIYFDEFCDRNNELRAFRDFMIASDKRFRLVGANKTYCHAVFECVDELPAS